MEGLPPGSALALAEEERDRRSVHFAQGEPGAGTEGAHPACARQPCRRRLKLCEVEAAAFGKCSVAAGASVVL